MFDGRTFRCQSFAVTEIAVEVRDLALVGEVLLQLLELERDVGHGRVDLAGDEVALAEGREELGERAVPRLETSSSMSSAGIVAGVGLVEVAEVVVAGDLAARRRRPPCASAA